MIKNHIFRVLSVSTFLSIKRQLKHLKRNNVVRPLILLSCFVYNLKIETFCNDIKCCFKVIIIIYIYYYSFLLDIFWYVIVRKVKNWRILKLNVKMSKYHTYFIDI